MSETADREPSGWRELPALQPKIRWLTQGDSNLSESEGVVCNLGFNQHCIVKESTGKAKAFKNTKSNALLMSSLVGLMDLNILPDEFEYRTRASLSDELRHLLSGKHVPNTDTVFSEPSPILSHKNMQEDENLLKSASTEHAHHSREKEPKEVDWKNGAPSPESILSYDFPNDSAYSVRQLDCQSDFTEGTNGLSLAPFGSNVGNPSNAPRSRAFSTDVSLNGFASGDAWDPNETLSTQERSETQDEFEEHSLHGLLPGLGTEDTSFEHTPHNAVLHLHDIHTNNFNTINTINTTNITQHNHRSPVLSTVLECSGTSEFSRTSGLGGRDTFSATVATPLSPDALFGEPIHPPNHSHTNVVVDTLVLPTVLNSTSKGLILDVLAEQGAEVKRVHSSAVALVTSYLTAEEARDNLIRNAGYLRVLVLEAVAGIVSAAVVIVESPLQSDLADLIINNNISTSTDTNISSSPCSSNSTASVPTSAASLSDPPTTPNSNHSAGSNDNNAAADSNPSQNSIYSSSTNGNNSPIDNSDTSANSSNNTSTTASTPVGMQESTYVLSDSAYIPAHPMTEHVPVGTAEDTDERKHTTGGAANSANTILPSFSEDSADYTNPNQSNKATTTNISNTIHTNSSNSPSPALPFARSAVVRIECALWSHYNTNVTKDSHDPPTSTTRAVPLQDYHYPMMNKDGGTTSGQSGGAEGNNQSAHDLQTELIGCIEMLLAQQASMHSPFRSTTTSTTNTAISGVSTAALPRRRASYHSLELDQRLYGHTTAAALHDLEATSNRMDMHTRSGGDSSSGDGSGIGPLEVPVPVPVLDAVLFWSPNAVASVSSETTTADKTHTLENTLLHTVQTAVQSHLRDPSDYPASTNKSDLTASLVTMEGSYIALYAHTSQMRQQVRDRVAQQPMLPLHILPANAVLHGAGVLQSLPCDVLRVYECSDTHVLQGGKLVLDTPTVGVIMCYTCAKNNTTTSSDILPGEQVIWLYNPVAAAAVGGDGYAAVGTANRDCCLLLTTTTTNTSADTAATTKTVKAEPCSVSRRSCPLKPSVSVRAFVQHPPPDTACVVQPSNDIYRSGAFLPDSTASTTDLIRVCDETDVDGSCGVLKGNLFFPTTQPATATVSPPAASQNVSFFNRIVGLYAAVCNRLHYLVFPGSTYYIQYYQADVSISVSADRPADSGSVGMEHTPGVQTGAVSIHPTPTADNATAASRWEVLIVTQPTLDYGTNSNIRIVNTIMLPRVLSYCQQLIALEEGNVAAEQSTCTSEFAPCLVSLSAANSIGIRSVIVQPMTGPSSEASTDNQDPTSTTATTATIASTNRRKKKQPSMQKRHYVKLTHSSYQLLQFREKHQREIRSVRNTIQCGVLLVLSLGALLMFIMLMEVMWVQRQYAERDVVTPTNPVSQPMIKDTDTVTATTTAPIRRVPTFTTTTTTTSTSSYTTTTTPSKAKHHTNSLQRMYYHSCKMNPVDPFLPAVCTTYVTNEETSELTVVVVQEEDVLQLHGGGRESMDMGMTAGGVKISDIAVTSDTTNANSRDSSATVSNPVQQPSQPSQPSQLIDSTTGAESAITSKIAPTAVPETVLIVQHDCGIIHPPDLGVVVLSAPTAVPAVLETEVVDSAERYMDPSASVDCGVGSLQEESLQDDNSDTTLSDNAKVKAVLAQMDSGSSFDYAAKEKLLADLEEISTLVKEIVQMLDGKVESEEPVSSVAGELRLYDLEVEALQDVEGLEGRGVDEAPAVVLVTADETATAATTTVISTMVGATKVSNIYTTTDTIQAYLRSSMVFGWLHTPPKPQFNTRLSAVGEFVHDVVHSIPPMCRYYMHQCQLYLQHYYHCTTQYLHHKQQQLSAWSAHTTHAAQRALQHTTYTITTSPFSKALQRHYATLHTTIAHTIDTYYPIIYDTLHFDELSAWTQEKAAIVEEDLHSLYEVTHLMALSAWLHTHSATIHTHMSDPRRATLKSQQELLSQGRQVWHTIVNASAEYARSAQRAVYSSGARLNTAVRGLGTTVFTHTVTMTEMCRVGGMQALRTVQRVAAGILTGF